MLWLAQSGSGASALSALAPEFDSAESYSAGDYVVYNGALYQFTTNHTGAWADADATAVTVGGELEDKQQKITAGTITLSATWSGSDPYTQTVTVSGATVTANSKIDLQPTSGQLAQLISDGVTALIIENNSGVLTAIALGAETSTAMTIACTVTEVLT